MVTIYRPTPDDKEEHKEERKLKLFFEEFEDLVELLSTSSSEIIITGDFNIHMDDDTLKETKVFNNILDSLFLKQHVNFSTHNKNHWLDLYITHQDCQHFKKVAPSYGVSDHFGVIGSFDIEIPKNDSKFITHRTYKNFNLDKFYDDIASSDLIVDPKTTASELYEQYHSTLSDIMDKHAPFKKTRIPNRDSNKWINHDIIDEKRKKRQLERKWRKTKLPSDRRKYVRQVHLFNRLTAKAKNDYYTKIIEDGKGNPKKLWSAINTVLHRTPATTLPDCVNLKMLASSFSSYFIDKIVKIRSIFTSSISSYTEPPPPQDTPPFTSFNPVSEEYVKKLVMSSPSKQCNLDPCPTSFVKDCINVLVTPITSIINYSLSEGSFPNSFKTAHVTPLHKKPTLPKNNLKNYRPVSNLNYISKLIEKVVAAQIHEHLKTNKLNNHYQSAYRAGHSTESALLIIQNDILRAMDRGKVTALTLLDLSAAFDTIDQTLLVTRLKNWFGLSGVVIEWLASYLTNRSQVIKIGDTFSEHQSLSFGVPQGSVLGPLLFSLYTSPLSSIINESGVKHHLYADDTQIYISFSLKDSNNALQKLKSTLSCVQDWMFNNKLKLNPDKTEFLIIGNKSQRAKFDSIFPIDLMGNSTTPSSSVRNLGVIFDKDLNFNDHVSAVCKSCNYHMRDFRRVRKHLNMDTAIALANALVSSRLDYCNSLLYGITNTELNRLQRIQNGLCRIITHTSRFSHITPHLKALHWLPVRFRIKFKICTLTYKAINTGSPAYLIDCLKYRNIDIDIRGVTAASLQEDYAKTGYGKRAYSIAAPFLWNRLPEKVQFAPSLENFRKLLKAHYFDEAYPP